MNTYEIIEPSTINEYVKKGYEFVTTVNVPFKFGTNGHIVGSTANAQLSQSTYSDNFVPRDMF